jgi:regulator of telomere elongation helicase 1
VETAELVLVPYNYLFDKDARESTLAGISWDNAVIIFDEAHNLESFASESASFDLSNQDVAGCVLEVQRALNYMQAMPDQNSELKTENVLKLKAIFLQLEDYILNLNSNGAFTGGYMMDIFQQGAGITHANHEIFIEEVRKVNELMMDLRGSGSTRGSPKLEHLSITRSMRSRSHGAWRRRRFIEFT